MNGMQQGETRGVDEALESTNGKVRLILQGDGNLVLYRTDVNRALWATDTVNSGATRLAMQADGNLVLYAADRAVWASHTEGRPSSRLVVQDDGNVVVYAADGAALWASDTVTDWSGRTADTGDVRLGTARWMHSTARLTDGGTIIGSMHIWCTWVLRGYTGSVVPMLLDKDERVLWPLDLDVEKHQHGVDGTGVIVSPVGSDRTIPWMNQVPPEIVPQVHRLVLVQFLDGKNRTWDIIKAAGEALIDVWNWLREKTGGAAGEDAPGDGVGVSVS